MAFTHIIWDRALETGHTIVDNQHKQWVAAVNALFEAHQRGKGVKEVERTMAFLVSYAHKHLDDEEELQEKYAYPGYPEHKKAHAAFRELAQHLAAVLHRDGPTEEVITQACITIAEWLINHIKSEDSKMAAFIRNEEQQRVRSEKGWTRIFDKTN
ncbi:MAG: hemerythrin family protein [Deltaproteobacteria bacterium]|jgi:hemerythrin|nr:hemerythrin family protein [Deltaproteobacteria bacterium]